MQAKFARIIGELCAATFFGLPSMVQAQERNPEVAEATPQVVERLFSCRKIPDPTERLACYDREVAVVEQAADSNELILADREQVREARRGLFGFTFPKLRLFDRGDEAEKEINEIEGIIASARQSVTGKLVVTLEDGARWIQTDTTPIPGTIRAGDVITIKKASLGSFMARIGKKRAFRIQRMN